MNNFLLAILGVGFGLVFSNAIEHIVEKFLGKGTWQSSVTLIILSLVIMAIVIFILKIKGQST